ncbi:MAG TPA: adenosine deaminase [Actinomycetota bacterium]|nr:adenosine deaminase [Actinomycetota bacterium]
MRDLRSLPKVELHLHLEGSARPATLREFADRDGTVLPHGMGSDAWTFSGPLDFIDNYLELCQLLATMDDFRRLATDLCEDLAATGVAYAEVVFSPGNHARRLNQDWFGPIEAVLDDLAAGERDHGVRVRLCPDIVRDNGLDDAQRTLEVALRFAGNGIVALNCAGSERTSVDRFAWMFRKARRAGLKSVPHAGEWAGPENVRATIDHLRPDRIGHGVRAVEDPALVAELADRRLPLEICPVSNVATGVYERIEDVPLLALRDAGVPVTLNSDDPTMFGGWLTDVYAAARDAWQLSDAELADLAHTAVQVSFADEDRKTLLRDGIDAWLAAPVAPAKAPAIP